MVAFAQRNLERLSADVPWWGRGAERGRKNLKIWVCRGQGGWGNRGRAGSKTPAAWQAEMSIGLYCGGKGNSCKVGSSLTLYKDLVFSSGRTKRRETEWSGRAVDPV